MQVKSLLAVALVAFATPVLAANVSIPQGDWMTTYIAASTDGTPQCVLNSAPKDGGLFMMKYFASDFVAVEFYHNTWKLPPGQKFKVAIGFNDKYVIDREAKILKKGDSGGFLLTGDDLPKMLNGLANGSAMWVGFKGSKPFHWRLSVNGAAVASEQFRMCSLALWGGKTSSPPALSSNPDKPSVEFKNGKGGI